MVIMDRHEQDIMNIAYSQANIYNSIDQIFGIFLGQLTGTKVNFCNSHTPRFKTPRLPKGKDREDPYQRRF